MSGNKKAMTLMEVVVVVVIISIVLGFGFPSYTKSIEKTDERNMIANLAALRATLEIYVNNGGTVGAWNGITTINSNLALSILDTKATYSCQSGGAFTNGCRAIHPNGWGLEFHEEHANGGIHCYLGTCPSCPTTPNFCG